MPDGPLSSHNGLNGRVAKAISVRWLVHQLMQPLFPVMREPPGEFRNAPGTV